MRNKNTAVNLESPAVIAVDPFLAKAEKNPLLAGLHGLEVHVLGVDSAGERRSPIGTVCGTSGLDIFVRAAHASTCAQQNPREGQRLGHVISRGSTAFLLGNSVDCVEKKGY